MVGAMLIELENWSGVSNVYDTVGSPEDPGGTGLVGGITGPF